MEAVEVSGKAGDDDTEMVVAASPVEPNDKHQEGTQLVGASQQELNNDPQEGVKLLVASQKEMIGDTQEGTELVAASQQELRDDTQEGAELVAASLKELNNHSQEGAEVVVACEKERVGNTQQNPELVAASLKEVNDYPQERIQLVVASQQELRNDTEEGTELVATSQKELNSDSQEGAELVVTSQQDLIDETPEETEMVATYQQEPNDNPHKKTELETASQKEGNDDVARETSEKDLNDDSQEATEVVVAAQKEVIDDNQDGAEPVAPSQTEPIDVTKAGTEMLAAPHKGINDDPQEDTKPVAATLKEVIDDPQEATELVVISQRDVFDDNQERIELLAASQEELINGTQERVEMVAVSQKEPEEPCSTNESAKATDVNSLQGNVSVIPEEQSVGDGHPTQGPVSRGRKMKWKDMARRKPNNTASPTTLDSQAIEPAVARKSSPRRRLPKRARAQLQSIPTQSPVNIAFDAIQQVPFPHSSPNVHNNLQTQCSTSPMLGPFPPISAHRQQLPYTQASPLRFDELLEVTNSVAWRPVTDCDTSFERLGAGHCVSSSASVQAPPAQTGEEFSVGAATIDNAGLPRRARRRLGSEFPLVSSGRPPRAPSSIPSIDFNRCRPSDYTNLSTEQQNGQQAPVYRLQHPYEANRASTNHVHPHGLNLPHACRQPLPLANEQFSGPSLLSVPELDPPDNTELPSTPSKEKSNSRQTPEQKRRNVHKRRLQQLRTQVIKKLKLWGRESKLIQEADGVGQYSNDRKRLIMGEDQRDAFVKNMVESCQKDPQMRETFLAAVKQLANLGVLHSSARLLMDKDPSGKSQEVLTAWKEMHPGSEENSSAAVNLYKAVDELHKQGEIAMRKLPPVDDTFVCSLSKTSEGLWELVFPDLGPQQRVTERNEERLDEPLRPS